MLLYLIFLLGGDRAGGKGVWGRLMSSAHEGDKALTRETPAKRGRVNRYGNKLSHGNLSI